MIASLALQKAIRAALIAHAPLTNLVPAEAIVDAHATPLTFPSIIIGDGSEQPLDLTFSDNHVEAFADVHAWTAETNLAGVKEITALVHEAMADLDHPAGFRIIWSQITATRFLRDPSGKHGHAVISLAARLEPTQ